MHVTLTSMRTTVEISDEQHAALVELAAKKGLKGFSPLVREAISSYLSKQKCEQNRVKISRALRGSLSGREANQLAESANLLRKTWR